MAVVRVAVRVRLAVVSLVERWEVAVTAEEAMAAEAKVGEVFAVEMQASAVRVVAGRAAAARVVSVKARVAA